MTDDTEPKPPDGDPEDEPQSQKSAAPAPRTAPARRDDSEKGIGLEMARLFGINPKLMMAPKATPQKPPEPADDDDEGQPDA
jgi:hypothetical protein